MLWIAQFSDRKEEGKKKMKNNRLWRGAVFVFLTLLPVAELLRRLRCCRTRGSGTLGTDGTPDRYSSRFELLIPVAIILLVGAAFRVQRQREQPVDFWQAYGAMFVQRHRADFVYVTFHPQVNLLRFSFEKSPSGLVGGGTGGGELPCRRSPGSTDEDMDFAPATPSDERVWERSGLRLLLHRRGTGGDSVGAAAERLCLCADFSGSHAGGKPGGVSVPSIKSGKTG